MPKWIEETIGGTKFIVCENERGDIKEASGAIGDDDIYDATLVCFIDSIATKQTTQKEKDFALKVAKKILEYDTGEIMAIFREDFEQEVIHYLSK